MQNREKMNKISLNSKEIEFLAYLEKKLTLVEPFIYLIINYIVNSFNYNLILHYHNKF